MTQPKTQQIGRLALRKENTMWNAYYAMPGTMEGAIWLGSIAVRLAEKPERRKAFMALMRESVGDLLEDQLGYRPTWPEPEGMPAPEHEKAGQA